MKIDQQKNKNFGNVYNIETVNNTNHQHINIAEHSSDLDIEKSKKEKLLLCLLTGFGLFADLKGLFPGLNLPWWCWLIVFLFGLIILAVRHGDAFNLSQSKTLQTDTDGNLLIPNEFGFTKKVSCAPCIYPNCEGTVIPITIPTNYNGPYNLMGECSITGKQHGYIIDDNLQAYPQDISTFFENELD